MERILFVAGEGLPFVKSGGLADVIGSLPRALNDEGAEVRVVLPLYSKIISKWFDKLELLGSVCVKVAMFNVDVRVFSYVHQGVVFYFLEHAGYFERDALYGYSDDGERFAFFQHAVFHLMAFLDWKPNILHCHDWHTGMMACLGRELYSKYLINFDLKYVYTIHNLAYQGNFGADMLGSCLGLDYSLYTNGVLAFNDQISFMKAGIIYSDKISTVSNTYAHEILGEQFGENMHEILRSREFDLWGIVNGIDVDDFNPETDKYLKKNYSFKTLKNKSENKKALQEKLGLRVSDDVCLVGMVTRLTWQKGISLLLYKLRDVMGLDIQLVVLGSGEASYEYDLRQSENMYKRRMVYYGGYSDEIAHQIYGAADLFLMPSLFEPCGISQLISMRYGTLPIVRETGGLRDTVIPYNQYDKSGTGFSFMQFNADDFYDTIRRAVDLYYLNSHDFLLLVENAMNVDVTWKKSAQLYMSMYKMVLSN